jgi:hypothetical protein
LVVAVTDPAACKAAGFKTQLERRTAVAKGAVGATSAQCEGCSGDGRWCGGAGWAPRCESEWLLQQRRLRHRHIRRGRSAKPGSIRSGEESGSSCVLGSTRTEIIVARNARRTGYMCSPSWIVRSGSTRTQQAAAKR